MRRVPKKTEPGLTELIEQATHELLIRTDVGKNMEIVDFLQEREKESGELMYKSSDLRLELEMALKKSLKTKKHVVQLRSLEVPLTSITGSRGCHPQLPENGTPYWKISRFLRSSQEVGPQQEGKATWFTTSWT